MGYHGKSEFNDTTLTFVNNTALDTVITVPANEMWIVYSIQARNSDNVDRAMTIGLYDIGTTEYGLLLVNGETVTATQYGQWPHNITLGDSMESGQGGPIKLGAGMKIRVYFAAGGASAGGTGWVKILIERFSI